MNNKDTTAGKRPIGAILPFPWRCRHCGKKEVFPAKTEYTAEVRHDGRLYTFTIPELEIPVCKACGQKVFTEDVDQQINRGLRCHLILLCPLEIRSALDRIGLSQKEVARRLRIAEATLSRWLNETQIQSGSMDTLLRVFFAFPAVRKALSGEKPDPNLGMDDFPDGSEGCSAKPSGNPSNCGNSCERSNPWPKEDEEKRKMYKRTQELVRRRGGAATWSGGTNR